jgi:carboxyl-terminal processing protease
VRLLAALLSAAACAAPAPALAQVPVVPPPQPADRELQERRAELVLTRQMVDLIRQVQREYVDALEADPLANRCADGMEAWLAGRSMRLEPSDTPPLQAIDRIGDLMRRVGRQYSGVNYGQLADACYKQMLSGLDKLSDYLDRESFRELQVGSGGMGGIGLELDTVDGSTRIVSAIDGAPAARSDLRRGDLIRSVDGIATQGLALADVVKLLRGKVGSTAALEISRGTAAPFRREIARELIRVQTVRSRMLPGGLLYVRVTQYQEATAGAFVQALNAVKDQEVAGIVIDLRNNTGGLLYSCIAMASVFLPETALVTELRGRTEENKRRMLARPEDFRYGQTVTARNLPFTLRGAPLAILVNRRSAACSEIFAAAMQDHKRATVIGEKTAGAGTVQTILPLGNSSAMKLTTARYFRPAGAAIEENPVVPDVALPSPDGFIEFGGADDAGLPAARKALLGR